MQYAQGLVVLTGLAAAGVVYAQSFTANTPASVTQCRPLQLTWTGGQAPFFPRVTAPGDINTILQDFGSVQASPVTWTVNQPAGQTFTFSVGDSAGNTANSGISPPILAGNTDCIGAAGSASSAPASSSSAAASSSSAAASSSSSAAASSSSARPSSSAAPSSSASRPSSSAAAPSATAGGAQNSANSVRGASAVVAGVVGVAVAALL